MEREIPVLYKRKEECCGCTACYAICPKEAISMIEDEEGFEYPVIDESKCIRCFQCIKVCPFKVKEYHRRCHVTPKVRIYHLVDKKVIHR